MVRFGILGCARICRRGMIEAIQTSGVAELTAIASRRAGQATQWAAEFGIPRAYESYEALIDDPAIEAVYLPLANEEHRIWTLKAAAAGKHVLCEKPLAMNPAEAEEMISACRRAGVMLMEAFMWRHHPRINQARQLIADGRLGELSAVKMDFSFQIEPGDWRLDPTRGAGALFDLGCYGINMARLFAGEEPCETIARARLSDRGVDLTTAFTLRFPSGLLALCDCSFAAPYRNRIEIVGARGVLELPGGVLPAQDSELIFHSDQGDQTIEIHTDSAASQYTEQVRAFCRGIKEGRLPAPAEDGLANMRVLCAIKDQAWATKW